MSYEIGLTICRHLVGTMSVSIDLVSEVGKGSTLCVNLPHFVYEKCCEKAAETVEDIMVDIAPVKILSVDGDTDNQKLIELYLSDSLLEVICVHNAEDALSYLKNNQPDLILMELRMPKVDGFELIHLIKQNPKHRIFLYWLFQQTLYLKMK